MTLAAIALIISMIVAFAVMPGFFLHGTAGSIVLGAWLGSMVLLILAKVIWGGGE